MKYSVLLLAVVLFLAQCTPTKETAKTTTDTTEDTSPKVGTVETPEVGGFDRSRPPKPGPAPKIQMGKYESFTLDNGLPCIVVKNTKVPRVSFQYSLNIDPVMEGEQAGMQDLMGQLLRRGTKNRSKEQIDEEIDFIGATLSTSSSGVFASGLAKYTDQILELMADVLVNPTFPEGELEKLRKQTLSNLVSAKNEPNAMASNVAQVLRYGKNHPYGEIATEETVKNITSKSIQKFYKTYFKPKAGYLVIVGDIDAKAAKAKLDKYLAAWEGNTDIPTQKYDVPSAPTETKVAFVDKPGAVQSVINVTYPLDLKPGSKDAIAASVANGILGGSGFASRLMQNLREDKAYTYGAGSRISTDPIVGSFTASASVRNEVTDSAVHEFIYEIDKMGKEKVSVEDLQKMKNIMSGSFARALERPQTVARFALNTSRYNLPKDYYEKYLENLAAVTPEDVLRVSEKYLSAKNAHVVVVGNKDDVAEKLKRFDSNETLDFYDNYGNKVETASAEVPTDVTGKDIIKKYIKARGGMEKLQSVNDMVTRMSVSAGPQKLGGVVYQKKDQKFKLELSMQGQVFQTQILNGDVGAVSMMGNTQKLEGKQLESLRDQAKIFNELDYLNGKYTLEVKAMEKVNGSDAYKVIVTSPDGKKETEYYDVKSGLKVKSIGSMETPQGAITQTAELSEYKEFGGIKFPTKTIQSVGPQVMNMTLESVEINKGIEDKVFSVE